MLLAYFFLAIICQVCVINGAVTGTKRTLDQSDFGTVEPLLKDALELVKSQHASDLNLVRIKEADVQTVAGKKYSVRAEFESKDDPKKIDCKVKLWHQPWSNLLEAKFNCDDSSEYSVKRQARVKRNTLVGRWKEIDHKTFKELEHNISESFVQAQLEGQKSYSLHRILGAQVQVVAGILYRVHAMTDTEDGVQNCLIDVWVKPWIGFRQVEVKCEHGDVLRVVSDYRPKRSTLQRPLMPKEEQIYDADSDQSHFNQFKRNFGRNYQTDEEEGRRFRIFQNNLFLIRQLNKYEQGSAIYGVTDFADLTQDEYIQRTGLKQANDDEFDNQIKNPLAEIPDIKLPKSHDWRDFSAVTPVKNQGSCGSCWAFSVTGNIEGLNAIKTGKLQSFSEQELVDCDDLDAGCNGGLPDNAVKFIEKEGGLELESDYPYTAHRSKQCNFNSSLSRVQVSGVIDFKKGDEDGMAKWLTANGPISIGINANAMQFYRGGVSHPWKMLCRSSSLDHGVLIVGYGVSEYPAFNKTLPYWIVKNSWGPRWGEQGYYRVYRGDNTCGVSSMASSAVLRSGNN